MLRHALSRAVSDTRLSRLGGPDSGTGLGVWRCHAATTRRRWYAHRPPAAPPHAARAGATSPGGGAHHDTITTYERLLRFDRDNLYERERLEGKRKQVNESIARLEPDNLQALWYLGQHQFAARRFAEAQQIWERILQQQPESPEAHFYLAAVRAECGQVEVALHAFHRALSLVIESYQPLAAAWRIDAEPPIEAQLAAIIDGRESIPKQDVPYAQALANFRQARHMRAQQYTRQGHEHLQHHGATEALPYLRWANAFNAANALASSLLKQVQMSMTFDPGLRYYQVEEYVQALRCFRETLALDPEHEPAKRYVR